MNKKAVQKKKNKKRRMTDRADDLHVTIHKNSSNSRNIIQKMKKKMECSLKKD